MPAAKFQIMRKCSICGNEFIAKTIESYYCSSACSKIAWKRRKAEEKKQQLLDEIVKTIPHDKEMITIPEAFALFGVSRETIYRLIRKGVLSKINSGVRKTHVSKTELMKLYPFRESPLAKSKPVTKLYNLEPENCYTIGEIADKYHLNDTTVYLHIRKYSIPTRQIGNFVYVPKKEIDELYKGAKK
jgi:excisionase family DNA binding protein